VTLSFGVILFGVLVLAYVAVAGLSLASLPSVILSYFIALRAWPQRSVGGRVARQLGVLTLSMAALTVLFVVVLFAGLDGSAAFGVEVFGVGLDNLPLALIALPLCVPAIVAGEVLMARRRRSE
jgi:hypothetical protein